LKANRQEFRAALAYPLFRWPPSLACEILATPGPLCPAMISPHTALETAVFEGGAARIFWPTHLLWFDRPVKAFDF
jgi:hypothetical protein